MAPRQRDIEARQFKAEKTWTRKRIEKENDSLLYIGGKGMLDTMTGEA